MSHVQRLGVGCQRREAPQKKPASETMRQSVRPAAAADSEKKVSRSGSRGKNIAEMASSHDCRNIDLSCRDAELADNKRVAGRKIVGEITDRLGALAAAGSWLSQFRPIVSDPVGRRSATRAPGDADRIAPCWRPLHSRRAEHWFAPERQCRSHSRCSNNCATPAIPSLSSKHDQETMLAADYLVDMGPGAGAQGGEVVAHGTPRRFCTMLVH